MENIDNGKCKYLERKQCTNPETNRLHKIYDKSLEDWFDRKEKEIPNDKELERLDKIMSKTYIDLCDSVPLDSVLSVRVPGGIICDVSFSLNLKN